MRQRILLATDAVGGVWQYSLELARQLPRRGFEPVLAVLGPGPGPAQREEARPFRLVDTGLVLDWLAVDRRALAGAGTALAELARDVGADIVQTASAALLAEADFDMPVVAVQHSCVASWWQAVRGMALPRDFAWRTGLVRHGLEAADAVVAPTRAFAATIRELYGLRSPVHAVHNGRSPLTFAQGAPHDFIFTAGRLWDEGKNLHTLDDAAARIAVPVYAAGPTVGPNGSAIEFENIHPLGILEESEVARWLSARPVFVSPSLYEPFGLSVLEAAMAGCPLVLSDIGTFRELWDGAALFVPARDSDALAAVVGELVGDDLRRHALGRAARRRAARYTPEATAERMCLIYRNLIGRADAPAPDRMLDVASAP